MRTVPISAPASGFVIEKKVVQGQSIQAGDELYTIADLSDVWVEAQLREEDAGRVSLGATATLDFTSYPGRPFTGASYLHRSDIGRASENGEGSHHRFEH